MRTTIQMITETSVVATKTLNKAVNLNRRKLLLILTCLTILSGILFAAVPFVNSLNPNDRARNDSTVWVEISKIPDEGALEVEYHWSKALIIKKPELKVFLFPYHDGAYRLPDPTWARPVVPCNKLSISSEGFACTDAELHEHWREEAQWNLDGKNQGSWMPDLETTSFGLQGKYLMLSPEYH